jgi:predicted nucleic acid-binding protein
VTLYVDSSALIKRYVDEDDSESAEAILLADPEWVTARITMVEVRLALQRRLDGAGLRVAVEAFERDWERTLIVAIDDTTCRRAAELGVTTGARSLDAIHLAAAERAGGRSMPIVTFDVRLGHAARSLGFGVVGS